MSFTKIFNKSRTNPDTLTYLGVYLIIATLISFQMHSLQRVFFILITLVIGIIFLLKKASSPDFEIKYAWLVAPILIIIISRLIPLWINGEAALGYDTGYYKHYLELPRISFPNPPTVLISENAIATRIILDFFLILGISPTFILYGGYILFNIGVGLGIFFLTKHYFNNQAGFFAFFFYSISIVQFEAYWNMLWKNIIGLFLIVVFSYIIEKKYYIWGLFGAALLAITHRTSAIIFIGSVVPFAFINKKTKHFYHILLIGFIAGLLFAYSNFIAGGPSIKLITDLFSSTSADFFGIKKGLFLETSESLSLSFLYLPFSILGLIIWLFSVFQKSPAYFPQFSLKGLSNRVSLIIGLLILSGTIILFRLFFYRRVYIYFDVPMVIFAGYGFSVFIAKLLSRKSKIIYVIVILFLLFNALFLFQYASNHYTIISQEELENIKKTKILPEGSTIISVSADKASWLLGWSTHNVVGPGLFFDKWSYEEWQIFWEGKNIGKIKELLNRYEDPVYLYVGQNIKPQLSSDGLGGIYSRDEYIDYLMDNLNDL